MTEDELKALTDLEMRQAIGAYGGKLSEMRRKAEYYYLGLAEGDLVPPEIEGRSTFVSTDVRNVIESMLPALMAKFVSGDSVVQFEATKPGDEDKADQCTQYLNYLFFKKVNGHNVTYTWFKDALLQKRGIIKVWWDTRNEETREEYKGLTDVELAQIMDDPEVEAIDHKSYPDEEDAEQRQKAVEHITQQMQAPMQQLQQAQQAAQQGNPQAQQAVQHLAQQMQPMQAQLQQIQSQPPAMLHDVSFKRVKDGGKICVENVPPEEFLISRRAKTINDASFVGHRVARTLSELRSMGYKDVDDITSDDGAQDLNAERIERLSYDDEQAYMGLDNEATNDPSQRHVWVTECYIRCDYDGDGIAELRKVTRAGNRILDNEVVDSVPFVSICPIPMPHKFFGLSIADVTLESQKTTTKIVRAQLDNMYLQVNGRYFAVENQVNLDDLLTSRPGGIVRIKSQGAVGRLDQGAGDGSAPAMMEWIENFKEDSTGWTKYSQGNDSKGLTETAEGMNIITNKADMRTDLIARHFAEGFVDLFRLMLKLCSQYQNKHAVVRLTGKWVDVDPREWRNGFDVDINVGLGSGNKDQQARHLMALSQKQMEGLQIGTATPEHVYELDKELAKAMGFKNGDKFFNNPKENPPPQQPNPEQMKMQGQMQIEQIKAQAGQQVAQVKAQAGAQAAQAKAQQDAQVEQLRMQMQQQTDNNRQQSEAEQHALKVQNEAQLAQLQAQYADQAHAREMAMEWEKAQLESATKIQVANIMSQAKLQDAATAAATNEVARDVT